MTQLIYKTSKTYYYGIELNANFSRKSFGVKIPALSFSKFENCRTIKLSEEEFEQFYNFSGDQWMELFQKRELRSKYLIFTEKVKRAKRKMSIVEYYNTYLSK
jgi:hypothetical protein